MCNKYFCTGHTVWICRTVHQSKWLKYTNFSLHVHEIGTMSVMIVFFFYSSLTYAQLFCRHLCYETTFRHKCGCIKYTQVSAVHSVSDAVSVVFVSDGFTNTNVV